MLFISLGLAGCETLGRIPGLGAIFRSKPRYYPYLADTHFSFEYPRIWGDTLPIHKGVELKAPNNSGFFSIAYLPLEDSHYIPPGRVRRELSALGAVEDAHRVDEIAISSRTAYRVRYTTYEYDPQYMLGQKVDVYYTEEIAAHDSKGMFLIRYQTRREDFWSRRLREPYDHFLESLTLLRLKDE